MSPINNQYNPVPEAELEDSMSVKSFGSDKGEIRESPIIYVDVAVGKNGKAMRISLYKSSSPEAEAEKFITENQLDRAAYY